MARREICCCGVLVWTKIIAWLTIIGYTVIIVMAILGLTLIVTGRGIIEKALKEQSDRRISLGSFSNQDANPYYYPGSTLSYPGVIVMLSMSIGMGIAGIVFGVFLLKGAMESNISHLKKWLVFELICLVWFVVTSCVNGGGVVSISVSVAFTVVLNGFMMWIVWTLIKEIEVESGLRVETPKLNSTHPGQGLGAGRKY